MVVGIKELEEATRVFVLEKQIWNVQGHNDRALEEIRGEMIWNNIRTRRIILDEMRSLLTGRKEDVAVKRRRDGRRILPTHKKSTGQRETGSASSFIEVRTLQQLLPKIQLVTWDGRNLECA